MKKILEKNMLLISIAMSILIMCGLKIEFIASSNYLGFTSRANDIMYLIVDVAIAILIYYCAKIKEKKLYIISIIVGIIFSICYYLGDIQNSYIYTYVPTSKKFLLYSIIKLLTYFVLFTNCVIMLFWKIPNILNKFNCKKEWKYFTNNKKSLFVIALIFFLSYVPFFLYYYPGNVNTDSVGSLYQITGISKFTNFQPILYTLLLGGLWNIGKAIFGSSVAGIAVYTLFQMICTSITFSFILYYMAKRRVDLKWRIITFLFLILNPLNGWFVVRCEKGILFHLSLILVTIGIMDIVYEKEKFFERKWKIIGLAIITLLMVFIRNNGIYGVILTIPFLILGCKKIYKQIIGLFGAIIVCMLIIQGPIFKVLEISYSSSGEALSIPIQQFARISKYAEDRMSEKDKEVVNRYFKVNHEQLANDYMPWKSDATKSNFLSEEFSKDKKTFILQYFEFAVKFPVQTISALVLNTGNNYSPNFKIWGIIRDYGTETQDAYETLSIGGSEVIDNFIEKYPLEGKPIVNFSYLQKLNDIVINGNIPIISNVFDNIGLYFWIMILCIAYCIYKKQYQDIIMMLPILGLWITAIAAPMVDIRYIYPMFLGTPIFMGIIGKNSKENI